MSFTLKNLLKGLKTKITDGQITIEGPERAKYHEMGSKGTRCVFCRQALATFNHGYFGWLCGDCDPERTECK